MVSTKTFRKFDPNIDQLNRTSTITGKASIKNQKRMTIPYLDFLGDGPQLHFAHANGYPPSAYRILLEKLALHYRVIAMHMRPLWSQASPYELEDWRQLADDLSNFLDEHELCNLVGVGHSMGATTTLRLALYEPERFCSLILIDPVLFPPWTTTAWDIIYRLGLGYRFHPLVRGARRRRSSFQSQKSMFNNYRNKSIFKYMNDESLHDYVESLACTKPDGNLGLSYTPDWEARIYVTGVRADMELWRALPQLKPPLLIIRGSKTNTFLEYTAHLVQKCSPDVIVHSIPNSTHLVPLEKPTEVYQMIKEFISAIL